MIKFRYQFLLGHVPNPKLEFEKLSQNMKIRDYLVSFTKLSISQICLILY